MKLNLKKYEKEVLSKNPGFRKEMGSIFFNKMVQEEMILYLVKEKGYPRSKIRKDVPVQVSPNAPKETVDIVVDAAKTERILSICCFNPAFKLQQKQQETTCRKSDALQTIFAVAVNGTDCFIEKKDLVQYVLVFPDEFPSYEQLLCDGTFAKVSEDESFTPTYVPRDFDDLCTYVSKYRRKLSASEIIGSATEETTAFAAYNMHQAFMDEKHEIPKGKCGRFEILTDCGVYTESYGNANGGEFKGPYRRIKIEESGKEYHVSFGVSSYLTDAKPDCIRTILAVAVRKKNYEHHSLQLVYDSQTSFEEDIFILDHNGSLTSGANGSVKRKDVFDAVGEMKPELLGIDTVRLGRIPATYLWKLDDPEFLRIVCSLIDYVIIREEVRARNKADMNTVVKTKKQ